MTPLAQAPGPATETRRPSFGLALFGYFGAACLGGALGLPLVLLGESQVSLYLAGWLTLTWHVWWVGSAASGRRLRGRAILVGWAILGAVACLVFLSGEYNSTSPVSVVLMAFLGVAVGALILSLFGARARALARGRDAEESSFMAAARWCLVPAALWSLANAHGEISLFGTSSRPLGLGWVPALQYIAAAAAAGVALVRRWQRWRRLRAMMQGTATGWSTTPGAAYSAGAQLFVPGDGPGADEKSTRWTAFCRVEDALAKDAYRAPNAVPIFVSNRAPGVVLRSVGTAMVVVLLSLSLAAVYVVPYICDTFGLYLPVLPGWEPDASVSCTRAATPWSMTAVLYATDDKANTRAVYRS